MIFFHSRALKGRPRGPQDETDFVSLGLGPPRLLHVLRKARRTDVSRRTESQALCV